MSATQRSKYSLSHLSDGELMRDLSACVVRDRATTAELLAHIAEVEERELYVRAGYASMHLYCVGELRFSDSSAYLRITAARTARDFPAIFTAVADGRLHLTAVVLLNPKLSKENAAELIESATHKTKFQIQELLAQRFPRAELSTRIQAIPARPASVPSSGPLAPERVEDPRDPVGTNALVLERVEDPQASGSAESLASERVVAPAPRPKVTPVGPKRYSLQLTMDQGTHDKLRHAQDLLSHSIPNGDVAQVLDRALDALIVQLEKRKFAKTDRPRPGRRRSSGATRYVPADVRCAVHARDGGQCTFVSDAGHRCTERKFVEYDHIDEVARGGEATVDNIRLRCRAHNQFAAEQTFGSEFKSRKREAAQRAAIEARTARPRPRFHGRVGTSLEVPT